MADGSYSIEDLERLLGLKARTIHYWAQQGLFEGPGAGRGSRYTDDHLARLFLIQKLRGEGRPLPEIKSAVRRLSSPALTVLAEQAKAAAPKEDTSARQLIRQWLDDTGTPALAEPRHGKAGLGTRGFAAAASPGASRWHRVPLAPGVELHVTEPLSPASQALVDELVSLARRLSKERIE